MREGGRDRERERERVSVHPTKLANNNYLCKIKN